MNEKLETTIATFDKYANGYQKKYSQYAPYLESYRKFAKLLEPMDRVLDIACGPGNISEVLLQETASLEIHGIDLSPAMLQIARERVPEGVFEQRDIRLIAGITTRFDAIVCGFGVPYLSLSEVQQFSKDVRSLLRIGGNLYLSAQLGDYTKSAYQSNSRGDRVYVYYYEESTLRGILLAHNFEIMSVERNVIDGESTGVTEEIFFHARRLK